MQHVPVHWGLHSKHYVGDRQSWQRQWSHSYTGGLFLLKMEWWGILSLLGQGRATLIWLWSLPRQPHCTSRILSPSASHQEKLRGPIPCLSPVPSEEHSGAMVATMTKCPSCASIALRACERGTLRISNFCVWQPQSLFRWQRDVITAPVPTSSFRSPVLVVPVLGAFLVHAYYHP